MHLFTPAFKPYSALLATKTYTGMPLSHKKKKKQKNLYKMIKGMYLSLFH